jgi:hypothetical protein
VGLTGSGEDEGGTWIDAATAEIYLTTQGSFSAAGVSGDRSDILVCDPGSLGSSTSCTFSPFRDGSANGFGGEKTDGITITNWAQVRIFSSNPARRELSAYHRLEDAVLPGVRDIPEHGPG